MIAPTIWITIAMGAANSWAVEREEALDVAAEFATHVWTMTEENETGSCDSSYQSDWTAGTWVGIPYDWGGWVTTAEYDEDLEDGEGAGSHSWHGVLSCTTGVDCSGFVSQAWKTDQKYGTATFYQVTTEIDVDELQRSDALNKSGSHIVMFAYTTDAGLPVHYETSGTVVFVDADQGWSAFSGYSAIRYEDIEEGSTSGTKDAPIEIDAFPFSHLHWTAGSASDLIDNYSCAPEIDESGPEALYHFETDTGGTIHITLSDDSNVDVDIHLLSAVDGDACLDRDDSEIEIEIDPGEYWIVADTYVSGDEFPGPYLLSATFDGELGSAPEQNGSQDTGVVADTGASSLSVSQAQPIVPEPEPKRCGCASASNGTSLIALLGMIPLGLARRRR